MCATRYGKQCVTKKKVASKTDRQTMIAVQEVLSNFTALLLWKRIPYISL